MPTVSKIATEELLSEMEDTTTVLTDYPVLDNYYFSVEGFKIFVWNVKDLRTVDKHSYVPYLAIINSST